MNLTINGEQHEINVQTVKDVVSHFKLKPNLIITEVDGEIVDQEAWNRTALQDGSRIEIVEFIGGG
ncbi:sulfur carrier protein ThiS [Salipaludibacillus aurantiacus]|uniref:Sulfur carrier protein n=1 Tax=Salipaludibacillus aurantiacus TaxID=1601833 RepID=A0A1H9WRW3_9BACI|nr:sulfur carrier protein ThiS [Salipaludibacillus aurantiacus]SES36541.1 sulfur carrier protein [Salipaludibacillus aurantiacus]